MKLIENKTIIKHSSFGEGIFKRFESDNILSIEFVIDGERLEKKFTYPNSFKTFLTVISKDESNLDHNDFNNQDVLQFNTSLNKIFNKNVLDSINTDKKVLFNESYIVIGNTFKAEEIYAAYDLTVFGDIEASKLTVNGNLNIIGSINVGNIICQNDLVCAGKLETVDCFTGGILIAEEIICENLTCNGNCIVKTNIDIGNKCEIDRSIIACEGITGVGDFRSQNAIVNEYFEFDGKVFGDVFEIETMSQSGKFSNENTTKEEEFDIAGYFLECIENATLSEEDLLIEELEKLSSLNIISMKEINDIFQKIIDLSYENKITNFKDYLLIVYAKSIFPHKLQNYETIQGVFTILLPQAEENLEDMYYTAKDTKDIGLSLRIIDMCKSHLKISYIKAADKIFSSIGILYSTAKKFISEE